MAALSRVLASFLRWRGTSRARQAKGTEGSVPLAWRASGGVGLQRAKVHGINEVDDLSRGRLFDGRFIGAEIHRKGSIGLELNGRVGAQ